jgi:hypothetical protein
MNSYLKVDESLLPELLRTEKLIKPIDEMTVSEYLEHLSFMASDELPPLSESSNTVVKKLALTYSKVMYGGQFRIAEDCEKSEEVVFHKHDQLKKMDSDLIIPYLNGEKRKSVNIWDVFIQSKDAPKYKRVEFNPNHDGDYGDVKNLYNRMPFLKIDGEKFNLSSDFSRDEIVGFAEHFGQKAKRFVEHLHDNITDSDQALFVQTIAWLADVLQYPARRPQVALVLRGEEKGTGKSTVADIMESILGKYYFKTSAADQIFGRFNSQLLNKLLIVGEEFMWGGNRDISGKIKDLITSSKIAVEAKGVDIIKMNKYFRLMLITNEDWVINASADERRYIVNLVNPQQAQNVEYFRPFYDGSKISSETAKEVGELLMSLDINGVDLYSGVSSKGLTEQKYSSMTPIEQWWLSCCASGYICDESSVPAVKSKFKITSTNRISKLEMHTQYLEWLNRYKPNSSERITSQLAFGHKFLKMAKCGKNWIDSSNKDENGKNCYIFTHAEEMMRTFIDRYN